MATGMRHGKRLPLDPNFLSKKSYKVIESKWFTFYTNEVDEETC